MKSDVMIRTAVFSGDDRYRYSLGRVWEPGAPSSCWIMLNPSIADAEQDDPTIRRCVGFARSWGHGSIVVVNLFAMIATYPVYLDRAADPIGPLNDETIIQAVTGRRVICAWGNCSQRIGCNRIHKLRALLEQTRTTGFCLGFTKFGNPSHPLYLPAKARLRSFNPPAGSES